MELACRNLTEKPSEANLVKLLDLWSTEWKHQGRTRAVGPGAFDKYCTLGLFGHGGVCGVSNATARQAACAAVNHFLKSRFPQGAWASIAVLFNPHMGLHRDIQNMIGQPKPRDSSRRVQRWPRVDRRRRRGLHGLAGRQEGRPGAARAVAGHARQARQLRRSPLPQGRTPRGQHVGSRCLCSTSLCSGDGAAPAGTERSGLPVACVKLIAGKREHFLGRWGKVGIPTLLCGRRNGPVFWAQTRMYGVRGGVTFGVTPPLRALFWGTKHACMVFRGVVVFGVTTPCGSFLGQKPRMYGVRGGGVFGTSTPLQALCWGTERASRILSGPHLCSGDGAPPLSGGAPGSGLRSVPQGLPGIPSLCRGPHLYRKGRPELAFDPSRRFGSEFRPAGFVGRSVPNLAGGPPLVSDGAPGNSPLIRPAGLARSSVPQVILGVSVPNLAGAPTCIRWCARNWPLIRPAGSAGRSVPRPSK